MAALFSITLFLSATLLFFVQPMLARMMLPLLGGSPGVWNTCMVFFQGMLLAGYVYAHWLGNRLHPTRQILIHLGLLLAAATTLPITLSASLTESVPAGSYPAWWLLSCLFLSAGLPFFAVATNAPLLQRWFSRLPVPAARDPYFLYAASNLGSLVALVGYPLVVEPQLRLGDQGRAWAVGFLVLIGLILTCGLVLWKGRAGVPSSENGSGTGHDSAPATGNGIDSRIRWWWCLLAFVPSSLMLGVTNYLTTDIGSIPLLWVLPLGLYLLTFIWVFGRPGPGTWTWAARVLPLGAIGLGYMILSEATEPAWILISLHLAVFFLAALMCHGRLAGERPGPAHLTAFYLWISIGGVLGGLFNALAAPWLFARVAEYPAVIILASLLIPGKAARPKGGREPWLTLGTSAAAAALMLLLAWWILPSSALPRPLRFGLAFGLPLLACYAAVDRPARFALALGAVLLAGSVVPGTHGRPLHTERNFFGVLRVTRDPIGPFYRLVHGNTIHGRQWINPALHREPLSYYHCTGPLGQIFAAFNARPAALNVGVVGLGTGAMACYARPGEEWTFYEINPAVARIAANTNYFTFLQHCAASQVEVVLGDARLRLRKAPPQHFGLLVLDAFSSDAIPLHLITREAVELYLSKLAPGGLLAFHISNRCLELEAVLGDLAKAANLVCHAHDEADPTALELAGGKDQSHWVVMGRRREDLGKLARDSRWLPVPGRAQARVWTDDFSDIISVFRWN